MTYKVGKVAKAVIICVLLAVAALCFCIAAHADTAITSGYDRHDRPFTNWMFTNEGASGTLIINSGTRRNSTTYVYGTGSGVRARQSEQQFWTANPLGKGFNK